MIGSKALVRNLLKEKPKAQTPTPQTKDEYLEVIRKTQIEDAIDHQDYRRFLRFIDNQSDNANFHEDGHNIRYCRTFASMLKHLGEIHGKTIIETGGMSKVSKFLSDTNDCRGTATDLRIGIDAEDSSADLILSLEVIEHLKDKPEQSFDDIVLFNNSGTAQFSAEILRILKPGGHLVLTTPNTCSYKSIQNASLGLPPMVFRRHVREYTRDELIEIFADLGLIHHETQYNFFMMSDAQRKPWEEKFEALGWSTENRGDDHFMIFQKPS
ncbi:MAG: methyltransferase domain-containing protein [Pseudomonadota bacterium]|nr:methyltransferase domain-containing protein [Pseudomonadota bacterium]